MHSFSTLAVAALAGLSAAQSAVSSGIDITVPNNTLLSVKWAAASILMPGILLTEPPVAKQPAVAAPDVVAANAPDNSKYTLVMIDPDIYPGNPSEQLLHYLLTNTTLAGGAGSDALNQSLPTFVPYLSPTPIPGTAQVHNYTLMLFRQPSGFQIPAAYQHFLNPGSNSTKRMGFNVADFARAGNLGDPVAANWFRVAIPSNSSSSGSPSGSGAAMSTMPSATGSGAGASSTAAFTNVAPLTAAGALAYVLPALVPLLL